MRINTLTALPFGLPGKIYRSPLPYSPIFDPEGRLLQDFMAVGADVIVMLTPDDEVLRLTGQNLRERYISLGFQVLYVPVANFGIPIGEGFQQAVKATLRAANEGQTIIIHCHGGLGRTGTLAACLAKVVFNFNGEEAIAWVRRVIPEAVETEEQACYVWQFELSLD